MDVRKKEEGTNWFSMAIFGINYPMLDNLWMESGEKGSDEFKVRAVKMLKSTQNLNLNGDIS